MKMLPFILFLVLIGCGKVVQKSSTKKQNVSAYFKSQEITVKVYYEVGAEPYISDSPLFQYWTILEQNLKALFVGRSIQPTVTVPKTLSAMTSIPDSGDISWTLDEVVKLAERVGTSSNATTFEVYFLNGHAAQSPGIIGFHISNTKIIALFKDVIRSTGNGDPLATVPKYVEQATLVHELGHALGLVNNGIPMMDNHHDKENGAHCTNTKCVMYWANEGAASLMAFAQEAATNGTIVMYDDKCLKDARSF
ncbi:MAG: hypothetical protein H0V66_04030 [Bdellovibrionales bacterium]|nr:hypothetical protein [Bdellovibrionales bacterium]